MAQRLKMMAEYRCFPLWLERDGGGWAALDPASLPLSRATVERLASWSKAFDARIDLDDPVCIYNPEGPSPTVLESEGLKLWRIVLEELEPDYAVRYCSVESPTRYDKIGNFVLVT